ncbi:MAG: hypothetical protein ACHQ0J_02875 [Candidatus Dormibacterales bacterium]
MATGAVVLSPGDFFAGLRTRLRAALPPNLRKFNSTRGRGRLVKIHYGNPDFHYEAWHHTGAGRLEIGLHFEGLPEHNAQAFDHFRMRMIEIKASLPRAELEPWDRGWSRLYETISAAQLDEAALERCSELVAAYITALQPLLDNFLTDET